MWLQQDVNINKSPLIVKSSLQDDYRQDWNNVVSFSSKCDLYRLYKLDHNLESFLKHPSPTVRKIICKFRTCRPRPNHKLPVESGRYANLSMYTSYCINCNMQRVDDAYHFLSECPVVGKEGKSPEHNMFWWFSFLTNYRYIINNCVFKLVELTNST